ncbi:MAG: COX15/CtaA family protein [Acidimicrobiales bacterium]
MRIPDVRPRTFLWLSRVAVVAVVLNVVSGAAVRLTDSGLGCPDWPTCTKQSVTPALSFHPVVEFANRMVVVALCIVVAGCALAAWRRAPRRRDLLVGSLALVAGVLGEAVVGAEVVYSKLNPYVVMSHFMVGMALLTVSVWLALAASRPPGPRPARTAPGLRRGGWTALVLIAVAVAAGTATTGAGPHAGGPGAVRLPVPLSDMARTHSSIVIAAGATVLLVLWSAGRSGAPGVVLDRGQWLLAAMVAQGVIGYTQYFTHLPSALVAIHVFGATAVWCAALWFVDGMRGAPAGYPGDAEQQHAPMVGTPALGARPR